MRLPEGAFWSSHPAAGLLAEQVAARSCGPLVTASGLGLTRTMGACMWPGIREGDLLFFRPLPAGTPLAPLLGTVALARDGGRIVGHRLLRAFGLPGRERFVLSGDLADPDPPRPRETLLGIVRAVYRPGKGFLDPPDARPSGPLSRALLSRVARLATWAAREGVR